MSGNKTCEHGTSMDDPCVECDEERSGSSFAAPAGSAALVREQDAANELYQAACTLMRYKETQQWNNLENAAHRFNAARQARILEAQMRQNEKVSEVAGRKDKDESKSAD